MASPDCPLLVCSRLSEQCKSLRLNRAKCELMSEALAQAREIYERTRTLDSVKEEFRAVEKRFQHLVDESSDPNTWLLKAVELWECSQHFVEVLMDACWSARIMITFNHSEALESQLEARLLQLSDKQERLEKECHLDDKKDLSDKVKCLLCPGNLKKDSDEYILAHLLDNRFKGVESQLPRVSAMRKCELRQISSARSDLHKHGGNGMVARFEWVHGKKFAVKTCLPQGYVNTLSFKHEFDVLDKHRSPYIVIVVGYWKVPKPRLQRVPWKHKDTLRPYLVMEAMDRNLEEFMSWYKERRGGEELSVLETIKLMLPVSKALRFLHARDVAHRDVKLQNIMCNIPASEQIDDVVVKLVDFGEAICYVSKFPLEVEAFPHTGTNGFKDPDMYSPEGRTRRCTDLKSADVFSFAMVFVELLTGRWPWEEAGVQRGYEVQCKLKNGERPPLPGDIPPYVRFIVESCWSADPFLRPSFDDICSMLQYAKLLLSDPTLVARGDFFSYLDATYVRRCYITEQN